jgi:predicted dehydrogenase
VCVDFGFRADINPEGRLFSPALAGGSLLDVGIYNLSLCSMIFGEQPESIQSQMIIGNTGVDEETSVLLKYKKGQTAQAFSAIRLNTSHDAKIIGENGRIELPNYWCSKKLKLFTSDGLQEFDLPYDLSGFQFEAMEVMRCLNEGLKESPLMTLDESLAIMKTLDIIRSNNNFKYPFD